MSSKNIYLIHMKHICEQYANIHVTFICNICASFTWVAIAHTTSRHTTSTTTTGTITVVIVKDLLPW